VVYVPSDAMSKEDKAKSGFLFASVNWWETSDYTTLFLFVKKKK